MKFDFHYEILVHIQDLLAFGELSICLYDDCGRFPKQSTPYLDHVFDFSAKVQMHGLSFTLLIAVQEILAVPFSSYTGYGQPSFPPPASIPSKFTILHTNDIHAHLDEFSKGGTDCRQGDITNNTCYGGIARMKTVIDQYRQNTSDVILLDAGDQFQGTLFFTYFKAGPSAQLMNTLEYDAMTLGNHEFDAGEEYLSEFISSLDFPVISANMDLTKSKLKDSHVKPYIVLDKYKLGIIGFITNTTGEITMGTKDIVFTDPIQVVQRKIDELHSMGIKRIIAVSHNGYFADQDLARGTRGLSLIVGGHSHSLLLKDLTQSGVVGPYPTNVTNLDGKQTFIVQAHRYGDYLGHLELTWSEQDELLSLVGDPILLDQTIAQDKTIHAQVQALRSNFTELTHQTVAFSTRDFPVCSKDPECAMGELIADCMLESQVGTRATIAWTNIGGIRASFPAGNVTVADVLTTLPFGNTVVSYEATGQDIIDTIEGVVRGQNIKTGKRIISNPQWAGLRYSYTASPAKVNQLTIKGSNIVPGNKYKVLTNDFTAAGGDSIIAPVTFTTGDVMADVVTECIKKRKTISPTVDGRISRS